MKLRLKQGSDSGKSKRDPARESSFLTGIPRRNPAARSNSAAGFPQRKAVFPYHIIVPWSLLVFLVHFLVIMAHKERCLASISKNLKVLIALNNLDKVDELLALDLESARKRRTWTRDWVLRRPEHNILYQEIEGEDAEKFRQAFRMPPEIFKKLLALIGDDIRKKDTHMRRTINIETRLQICLRYLASGANFRTLEDIFRVPHNTISGIITETTEAIWNRLCPTYLTCPRTKEEWCQIAQDFHELWNYPYCLGAVDGKHVQGGSKVTGHF